MGAPMIEDERLYSFFVEYKAKIDNGNETPTSFSSREKPQVVNKSAAFWETSSGLLRETKLRKNHINGSEVLRHMTACFTEGVRSKKNLSRLKAPDVISRLPHMYDEDEVYCFFLFWLELPTNEWLDAFLFEVAASWKDITEYKRIEEKLSTALDSLVEVNVPDHLNLEGLLKDNLLDSKSSSELSDKIYQYKKNVSELNYLSEQMCSIIRNAKNLNLPRNEEVELTDQFFKNGFLMRRVRESKRDIGAVRYALRDLELESINEAEEN